MKSMTTYRPSPKTRSMVGMDDNSHVLFSCKLGWELRCEGRLDDDPFDGDDTLYVVATDDDGAQAGSVRLLPTTQPYLLGSSFTALMQGLAAPASPQVWELSRLNAPDFDAALTGATGWRPAPVAVGLLHVALQMAAERGAERVITIAPLGLERLLLRTGLRAHRAAPPLLVEGHPLVACWIECR